MRPYARAAVRLVGSLIAALACSAPAAAQYASWYDPSDSVVRRTDDDGNGWINPQVQRLPDIREMKVGRFAPNNPATDLFAGGWNSAGAFLRFDLLTAGLVNPPGPVGQSDTLPEFEPLRYGPNPIFGWVELDIDNNINTGGELETPQYRYLANVARFGGLPDNPALAARSAVDAWNNDHNVGTPPFVDRSGEEFHIAFMGERINSVTVLVEKPAGNPAIFEAGETWIIHGDLWHRAHGFEEFVYTCLGREGQYMPQVRMRFAHDLTTDRTLISLVYPLTNAAAAAQLGAGTPVEPEDGCDGNQNSISEALGDLQFSATFADPFDRGLPEFQLLAGWEFTSPTACLNAATWSCAACCGTAYTTPQPDGALYIWTDVWPNPRLGDFDGDDKLTTADVTRLYDYIAAYDGDPNYDDDGNPTNSSLLLHQYASNFCLYDTNYDGIVSPADALLGGDMEIDLHVDANDIDDLVLALLNPAAYSASHGGVDPRIRGDLNGDGRLDGADINEFVQLILCP